MIVNIGTALTAQRDAVLAAGLHVMMYGVASTGEIASHLAATGATVAGRPAQVMALSMKRDVSGAMLDAAHAIVADRNGRVYAEDISGAATFGLSNRSTVTALDSRFNGYLSDAPGYLDAPTMPVDNNLESAKAAQRVGLGGRGNLSTSPR